MLLRWIISRLIIINVTVLECLAVSLAMKYAAYPIDLEYLIGHQENMLKLLITPSHHKIFVQT